MTDIDYSSYNELIKKSEDLLKVYPSSLIVVTGRTGVGKTTLARYLAWKVQVSLIETDLFLCNNEDEQKHDAECIREILARKRNMGQSVIIEGCIATAILHDLGIEYDFLVYVERQQSTKINSLSRDPFFCENTTRQVLDPSVFGSSLHHSDSRKKADFIVSI